MDDGTQLPKNKFAVAIVVRVVVCAGWMHWRTDGQRGSDPLSLCSTSTPTKHVMSSFRVRVQLPTKTTTQRSPRIRVPSTSSPNFECVFGCMHSIHTCTHHHYNLLHTHTHPDWHPPQNCTSKNNKFQQQESIDNENHEEEEEVVEA